MFFKSNKENIQSISVNEINPLLGQINLIDVRESYEYDYGHLRTAKNIPMNILLSEPEKYLDDSKEYHIICHSGSRSAMTCSLLKNHGYKVINVAGGTGSYRGDLEE